MLLLTMNALFLALLLTTLQPYLATASLESGNQSVREYLGQWGVLLICDSKATPHSLTPTLA